MVAEVTRASAWLLGAVALIACSSSTTRTAGTTAAGTDAGTSGSSTPTDTSAASLCVSTINDYRATANLPAYARWDDNESCTAGQATSDGTTKKAHGAFGTCEENAQDECPGWPAPAEGMITDCLKQMFAEGPGGGHYDNMMSTKYTKVSCGFATAADGSIWAVQNFR